MLAIEVEYLMGRVVASRYDDRRAVEWPPHPGRLFAALVAAYKECELGDGERNALAWLESLPPPHIYADPPDTEGYGRDVHDTYVPINDASAIALLPERRTRQARWFPAFTPNQAKVWFVWPDAYSEGHRAALQRIAENVAYLGHSMSPVRVTLSETLPDVNLAPAPKGDLKLRTPGAGRLDHLEAVYALRLSNAQIQPHLGRLTRYGPVHAGAQPLPASHFRHSLVFSQIQGPRMPLEDMHALVALVRNAVLDLHPDPVPEVFSGHTPDGAVSQRPHMAVIPLANVAHRYADGRVMGFALLLPEEMTEQEHLRLEEAMDDLTALTLGGQGVWEVKRIDADARLMLDTPQSLRLGNYTRPSETWASVTPVVFGHYPKTRPGKDLLAVIGDACELTGLPRPAEVRMGPVSACRGVPKASDFHRPKQAKGRLMAHVYLRFGTKVRGPVLLGTGRYVGLGLCRPCREQGKCNG